MHYRRRLHRHHVCLEAPNPPRRIVAAPTVAPVPPSVDFAATTMVTPPINLAASARALPVHLTTATARIGFVAMIAARPSVVSGDQRAGHLDLLTTRMVRDGSGGQILAILDVVVASRRCDETHLCVAADA